MAFKESWAAALLLFGCQPERDLTICDPIREVATENRPADNVTYQIAERCVHRAAYKLARDTSDANLVARAARASCDTEIFHVDDTRDTSRFFEDMALKHVIEARLGHCTVESAEADGYILDGYPKMAQASEAAKPYVHTPGPFRDPLADTRKTGAKTP